MLLHLLPFGRNLKCEYEISNFGGLAGCGLYQPRAHPRFPNTSQYKILLYLQPYGRNSNVTLWYPIRPVFQGVGAVRVDLEGRKWYQSKCHPHIPIRVLYTLHAYLAPFDHDTQSSRQMIGLGRLCHRIGGLQIFDVY